MSNPLLIRFSLARLLLLVTAIVLVIGFCEARRRSIVREARSLAAEGVAVAHRPAGVVAVPVGIPDDWVDRVWQRRPNEASLHVTELTPDKFRVGDAILSRRELLTRLLSLEERARALGARNVDICADGTTPYTPSNWAAELNAMTDARVLACNKGDRTYDHIPGLADEHKRR